MRKLRNIIYASQKFRPIKKQSKIKKIIIQSPNEEHDVKLLNAIKFEEERMKQSIFGYNNIC